MKIRNYYEKLFQKINFFIGFIVKSRKILDRAFCIFPITLSRIDPQHWVFSSSSPRTASKHSRSRSSSKTGIGADIIADRLL